MLAVLAMLGSLLAVPGAASRDVRMPLSAQGVGHAGEEMAAAGAVHVTAGHGLAGSIVDRWPGRGLLHRGQHRRRCGHFPSLEHLELVTTPLHDTHLYCMSLHDEGKVHSVSIARLLAELRRVVHGNRVSGAFEDMALSWIQPTPAAPCWCCILQIASCVLRPASCIQHVVSYMLDAVLVLSCGYLSIGEGKAVCFPRDARPHRVTCGSLATACWEYLVQEIHEESITMDNVL